MRVMTRFRLEARPTSLDLDIARTAVLVVDMQNDFGEQGGMFARAGIDITSIRAAVAPTARVLAGARAAGMPIVYLKMGYAPDLSDLGPPDAPNRARHMFMNVGTEVTAPDGRPSRILVRDTWNTEIVRELTPAPDDVVMWKHRFSGFFETDLHARLTSMGVRSLVVTGCTTSVCVESTLRDAMFRDYACVLLEDCTGEPIGEGFARSNHEASLLTVQTLFGWVADSRTFLEALATAVAAPAV